MYRLLLISDDAKLTKTLKAPLQEAGYQLAVQEASVLQKEEARAGRADALLLDIAHLPEPGHACRLVKRQPTLKDVPLVLLVPEARMKALDWQWGFDEFVPCPTSAQQLISRLQFLLWRLNRVNLTNGLKSGDLTIDFEQFTVSVKGEVVDLTFKEYELLRFLASHPGKVFTREVLLNKVWGYDFYGGTRTVDVHIRRLRSKLEDAHHTFIETIRHVGYKFLPPEE